MVHRQPRPYPVFPEHSAGVGPLYLSVVAGSLLLPSSLLPRPWAHSDVGPLRRQNGETPHGDFGQASAFVKLPKSVNSTVFCFLIGLLLLLCHSGAGLLAGILRLCGVFLHSSGEKSGDPPAHGLPPEPNHTQHDCGNFFGVLSVINIHPLYSCLDVCMENY